MELTAEEWVFYLWDRGWTITDIASVVMRHGSWVSKLVGNT